MQTTLQGIANKAKREKGHRFGNLYELLNERNLLDCWRFVRKNAAYGVDRVSAQEYGKNLAANVRDLVERLKRKRYRAKLVRRRYIPKGKDKVRPLGIPAVEDKLLQLCVTRILTAIYEQDFLRCSYGYRPGIGALDAVDKLTVKLQFGEYHYVVDADIHGFFDHMDHDWMLRMLEERIEDKVFLRLIRKWLKAGGAGDGRTRGAPGDGGAARRDRLAGAVEHLPSLRAGPLVPQGRAQALPWRSLPDPVCR